MGVSVATYQETVCFYTFSKHVSISVSFFVISVSCLVAFAEFLKLIAPGWGFGMMFCSYGSGFAHFCSQGMGNSPIQKSLQEFCPGEMVRLGIY